MNTSAGFANLINTTLPDNTTCTLLESNGVECSSPEEILALTSPPVCDRPLTLVIMDINRTVVLNETLYSSTQLQQIQYTILGNERQFNISVQVVSSDGDYYILSLNDPSTGLQFPETAIPVIPLNCTTPPSSGDTQDVAAIRKLLIKLLCRSLSR